MLEFIMLGDAVDGGGDTLLLFQASVEQTSVPVDVAKTTRLITRWDSPAGVTNAQQKFGDYSFQTLNGGFYLSAMDKHDLVFSADEDFTIEWFARHISLLSGSYLIAFEAVSTNSALYRDGSNLILCDNAGNIAQWTYGSGFPVHVWHHIAIVGNDTTLTLYVDGVARSSIANRAGWSTSASDAVIMGRGGPGNSGGRSYCYMDQFRISKLARYTDNFTPPTEPFKLD